MKLLLTRLLISIALISGSVAAAEYNATGPSPRLADGTTNLGSGSDGLGYWGRGPGPMVAGAYYPPPDEVPFKPWARALYDYRQATLAKDDPHVRCAPPGGPRQFAVPFGLQLVQVPHMNKIFIHSGGSTRPWREIHMDGRGHPEYINPSYFGHSIGHWEGDILIVDTIGFNERFWIHREGYPHTESLHLIEYISRPQMDTLRYEVTLDDPAAYTEPWSTVWTKTWEPEVEFIEYFCQDNNIDQFHMMGSESLVQ